MEKSTRLLLALAAGTALTAFTAILIAPDKVKKISKKTNKKGKKLWKKTKKTAGELVQKSAGISANIKDAFTDIKDKVISEGKELLS